MARRVMRWQGGTRACGLHVLKRTSMCFMQAMPPCSQTDLMSGDCHARHAARLVPLNGRSHAASEQGALVAAPLDHLAVYEVAGCQRAAPPSRGCCRCSCCRIAASLCRGARVHVAVTQQHGVLEQRQGDGTDQLLKGLQRDRGRDRQQVHSGNYEWRPWGQGGHI